LLGQKVFYACAVCYICDAVLIALSILGVSSILQIYPFFLNSLVILGAMFLYSVNSFIRAYQGNSHLHIEQGTAEKQTVAKLMLTTVAITLLNPHVNLDSFVIIGCFCLSELVYRSFV
jgi:L-lysine exporter family protein LysE/ArgO